MLEQGLIIETRDRPELDDERRRYYRITPFGILTAKAETRRLALLVKLAHRRGRFCSNCFPARSHRNLRATLFLGEQPAPGNRREDCPGC